MDHPLAGNKSNRLRILFLVGWWPDNLGVAGIFIKEHILAVAADRSVEVVFMEVFKVPWTMPRIDIEHHHEDGLPVHRVRISTPLRRLGFMAFLVRRAYAKVVRKLQRSAPFDLLHVHVRTEVTEQIMPLAERMWLPVVVTEQNSYYHLGIRDLEPNEQQRERKKIIEWFSHPLIVAVMPVSHDLSRVLQLDFGVDPTIMTVVPNIANDVFKPGVRPDRPPFRIALAAVWRPPKDSTVFIDALRMLRRDLIEQCRVDWAGYGPDMAGIQDRCNKELSYVDIRFPGKLEKRELARLMQRSHLFVLPTKADNFPCVVLESLSCGTPVVSMEVNGVPEMIDRSNGVLVAPSDPVALAKVLENFILEKMHFDHTEIARAANEKFSSNAVAKRIEFVYQKAQKKTALAVELNPK